MMNNIFPAASLPNTGPLPLDSSAGSKAASGSNSASTPNNQLDGNSFITLLTAQLQAQDPLNPLDPNQMVSELTQMNTLQQIIQIREDMDALLRSPESGASLPQANNPNSALLAAVPGSGARAAVAPALRNFMPVNSKW